MGAPLPLETQTAVITGAAAGAGREIAQALHAAGFRVILADTDAPALYALAEKLDLASELALTARLDPTVPADFARVLDKVSERWGSVELLVNAATATHALPKDDMPKDVPTKGTPANNLLQEVDPGAFSTALAASAGGVMAGMQVFARHFAKRGYGRIINVLVPAPQDCGSLAAAGAIRALTTTFARDLFPLGITCNCITLGPATPAGLAGDMAVLLASPAASQVNGACWDDTSDARMR